MPREPSPLAVPELDETKTPRLSTTTQGSSEGSFETSQPGRGGVPLSPLSFPASPPLPPTPGGSTGLPDDSPALLPQP